MSIIADEMIAGFKGGPSIDAASIRIGKKGGIYFSKAGRYPFGIWQQRSPDGKPYERLKKVTIRVKRELQYPTSPTPNLALLNQHELVHGLVPYINVGGNGLNVHFRSDALAKKSRKMEEGGSFRSRYPTAGGEDGLKGLGGIRQVVARRHRGIQPEVARKIRILLRKWLGRYAYNG